MKRFNKTAIALATAGAMTFAIVPDASAQGAGWFGPENPPELIGGEENAVEGDGTEAKPEDIFKGNAGVEGETWATEIAPEDPEEVEKPSDLTKPKSELETWQKALIGVGATVGTLLLGGILYNIVQNSKGEPVLVPADRADQTPNAEDEAKTKELVENNAAEIAAQAEAAGDVAAADRGVGAATGNNVLGKGLIGLLIASVMGAAVFAYGRRQLV